MSGSSVAGDRPRWTTAVSRSSGREWLAIVLTIVAFGCPGREEIRPAGGSHPLPTLDGISFGDANDMSGNSFSRSVSGRFGEGELRRVYLDLNGPEARSKLQSYVCPAALPDFKITVALYYEGSYQERLVRLQMTPPLYKQDGRIENGIGYLFEQAVKKLDNGPPIDYGYRHPLDGSKANPQPPVDVYAEPARGNCESSGGTRS